MKGEKEMKKKGGETTHTNTNRRRVNNREGFSSIAASIFKIRKPSTNTGSTKSEQQVAKPPQDSWEET